MTRRLLNGVTEWLLSQIEAARSEFLLVLPKIAGSFLLKPVSACLSLVRTQVGQGGNVRT